MFGSQAVRLARDAVESEVRGTRPRCVADDPRFSEPSGAFVTLSTHPGHDLRGCIGYPLPHFPLGEAISRAAASACHDPRFPDLREDELPRITVEVTVLTVPERIPAGPPETLADSVVIGRDGLIIELMGRRGLLLPQVPVEWGWDGVQFLRQLSVKAGLPPDAWTHPDAVISRFSGEIFREESPYGDVVEG